jgi:hypothetical protein
MDQNNENIETITVDGETYNVADLSPEVQNLAAIYGEWQADGAAAKKEYLKCTAALRDLSREIGQAVRKANAPEEADVAEPNSEDETVAANENVSGDES